MNLFLTLIVYSARMCLPKVIQPKLCGVWIFFYSMDEESFTSLPTIPPVASAGYPFGSSLLQLFPLSLLAVFQSLTYLH